MKMAAMINNDMVTLWPSRPTVEVGGRTPEHILRSVFPSGRQAIVGLLRHLGFTRTSFVAIPEWSSSCVISGIGVAATPVPLAVLGEDLDQVNAVLCYEQWGWPFDIDSINNMAKRFPGTKIVVDGVDTPVLNSAETYDDACASIAGSVISLSKTLGLVAGGLAMSAGVLLPHSGSDHAALLGRLSDLARDPVVSHVLKLFVETVHPEALSYLATNNLDAALRAEREARESRLRVLRSAGLTKSWPHWMRHAVKRGCCSTVAPLFIGHGDLQLETLQEEALQQHGFETAVYHFNTSNNLLERSYKQCLAIPVHGGVPIERLKRFAFEIGDAAQRTLAAGA